MKCVFREVPRQIYWGDPKKAYKHRVQPWRYWDDVLSRVA